MVVGLLRFQIVHDFLAFLIGVRSPTGDLFKAASTSLTQVRVLIDDADLNARRFNHSRSVFKPVFFAAAARCTLRANLTDFACAFRRPDGE